jgi:hypothetical protein
MDGKPYRTKPNIAKRCVVTAFRSKEQRPFALVFLKYSHPVKLICIAEYKFIIIFLYKGKSLKNHNFIEICITLKTKSNLAVTLTCISP